MAYGYFPPPFLFQIVQFHGSRFLVRCVVYILHVSSKLLFILVNDIFTRVSDLMHNADLRGRLREHTTYGVGKSVQIVCVSNKNILYTTCFQVGQNTHPESGTFRFADPHTQNFLQTVLFRADTKVYRFVDDLTVITHLKNDTVHPYYQIYRVKRAVLPFQCRLIYLVGDDGYGRSGKFNLIDLTHLPFNVRHTHSFSIEGDNEFFYR